MHCGIEKENRIGGKSWNREGGVSEAISFVILISIRETNI